MLALSITATALSDLSSVGQPATAQNAPDGFQALLDIGSNNSTDTWGNGGASNNDNSNNNQSTANNPAPPANTPPSIFAANNSGQQNAQNTTPLPPAPPQPPAQQNTSSSTNNDTQNASNSPPAQTDSTPPSNNSNQNANSSTSNQSSAPDTSSQTTGGNTAPSAKQLRSQIQDELGNISQILLSMIQALSGGAAQPVQTTSNTSTTPQITPAGNNTTDPTTNGQTGTPSTTDQEIGLLQDMRSLLQQLQQSLDGQGQNQDSQNNNMQTLSNSLLSDMAQLSQLAGQVPTANNSNTNNALFGGTQLGDLSSLLKSSITQAQNQLQNLQAANETIFAQATAGAQTPTVQTSTVETSPSPKTTQDNNSTSANTAPITGSIPVAPVAQDTTIKSLANGLPLSAPPVVQANVSQGGGNSAGGTNQDSSQNQLAQPIAAAGPSSPSSTDTTGGASFARILNQVSQSNVLDQVQFQVKTALSDGSSKISIQLNPPELGKVDVKFDVSADGKTTGITVTADNQNTLNLLKQDTQGLTRALNDAGLTTDSGSLNFSLSGGQQNQTQGSSQQAAVTYQQAQPEEDPTINAISRSYVVNLAEGLDITI